MIMAKIMMQIIWTVAIMMEVKLNDANNEGYPPGLFGHVECCHSGPLLRHPHLQQASAWSVNEQEGHPALGAAPLTFNFHPATVSITVACTEKLFSSISVGALLCLRFVFD